MKVPKLTPEMKKVLENFSEDQWTAFENIPNGRKIYGTILKLKNSGMIEQKKFDVPGSAYQVTKYRKRTQRELVEIYQKSLQQ